VPLSSLIFALLDSRSISRAAPARIWMLPDGSVLSLSPSKTVAPADADPAPTCARRASSTVPKAVLGALQTGIAKNVRKRNAATLSRNTAIAASKKSGGTILSAFHRVNV
jgi:hypothetical protein